MTGEGREMAGEGRDMTGEGGVASSKSTGLCLFGEKSAAISAFFCDMSKVGTRLAFYYAMKLIRQITFT